MAYNFQITIKYLVTTYQGYTWIAGHSAPGLGLESSLHHPAQTLHPPGNIDGGGNNRMITALVTTVYHLYFGRTLISHIFCFNKICEIKVLQIFVELFKSYTWVILSIKISSVYFDAPKERKCNSRKCRYLDNIMSVLQN